MRKKNMLSLYDGMSCFQLALNRAGIKYDNYYASEINERSMLVTKHHYPDTKFLGNVRDVAFKKLKDIFILAGGSPCTDLSIAGRKTGMLDILNFERYLDLKEKNFNFGKNQSYLFFEFVRALYEAKPKYFLFENVWLKGQMKKYEKVISDHLGVEPIHINSNTLSAQNRDRLYWVNIPGVSHPKDLKILSTDVIPGGYGAGIRGRENEYRKPGQPKYDMYLTVRTDHKFNCITKQPYSTGLVYFENGKYRVLTPEECEVLQTVPVGHTNVPGVFNSNRYEMLGNGWTIDVICHLLKGLTTKVKQK